MSKVSQALAVLVHFASVAWREVNNYRKDYGDLNAIRNSLAQRQWNADNPVPVVEITDEELEAELKDRQTRWDSLKEATTAEAAVERQVFEMLYTEGGKLIRPKYSGNAGFRRHRAFFPAMVQRFKDSDKATKQGEPALDISGMIPVRVTKYASKIDRIIDQQTENELQGVGTKKMDDLEKLRVTYDLFQDGCRESDIRRLYSSSTGQKTFGLCMVNANWPDLKIIDRMLNLPTEHPDYVKWGPVRHNEISKFNQRYDAQRKRKEGLPLKNDERGLEPITAEEVDNYFRDRSKGEGANAPKIMTKSDILSGSKQHKLDLAKLTFDTVYNNVPPASLKKAIDHAEALNHATQMVLADKGDDFDVIMEGVKADPSIFVQVAKLIRDGKLESLRKAIDSVNSPVIQAAPKAPTPKAAAAKS